ncbi:aldose 1-epimerase [Paraburkholderia sacchari]|uniref:aldose 1-epimerase n=1 Tax=Paraburkholderia sacchari TaxID=159450 RepID=UPI0005443EE2|nr:aldose 1-epimerase [Paraburkholderia sacchari]NLP63960.1 aldose 1-epimerase [Paraburkholderia sacchari]
MSSAPELFALEAGSWRVRVAPSLGGAIVDARWCGRDVLRPMPEAEWLARNVRKSACYPLVPFSNRIAFGAFRFGDTRYTLVKNLAGINHAIHGTGFQRAWQIQQTRDANAIDMRLSHQPDDQWPFAFEVQQRISIDAGALVLSLRVTNTDTIAAPCGVGWHPFFPLDTEAGPTWLHTEWSAMLVSDANDLPCSSTLPPQFDALDDTVVDNCFTGWSRSARIDTPHHRVSIEASDTLRCAVLFRPADQSFFAFEPVSHANNALNGIEPPMHVLAPHEALEARMTISVQAPTADSHRSEA